MRVERFRHADGEEVTREIVRHAGAVGMLAYDERELWLVRQPREAVGEPDLLEIPAGRLDKEGEEPLAAAQRELAEEIGRGAERWEPIVTYYTGAGLHRRARAPVRRDRAVRGERRQRRAGADRRSCRWPLTELDAAIAECRDAKTLIALYWLRRKLNG